MTAEFIAAIKWLVRDGDASCLDHRDERHEAPDMTSQGGCLALCKIQDGDCNRRVIDPSAGADRCSRFHKKILFPFRKLFSFLQPLAPWRGSRNGQTGGKGQVAVGSNRAHVRSDMWKRGPAEVFQLQRVWCRWGL